jgi:DNA-binding transcriptional regulator/RsmH inhibitor MraZ
VQAVIIGSGDYIEIWSPDEWSVESEQLQDAQLNAHRFAALDLTSE